MYLGRGPILTETATCALALAPANPNKTASRTTKRFIIPPFPKPYSLPLFDYIESNTRLTGKFRFGIGVCRREATACVHKCFRTQMSPAANDEFRSKGAVEQDRPRQETNTSLSGQIGHRNKGPLVDTHDTDFPEPGQNPEHSGEIMQNTNQSEDERERLEREGDVVQDEVDQDPGERQKRNQNDEKDDPLAA